RLELLPDHPVIGKSGCEPDAETDRSGFHMPVLHPPANLQRGGHQFPLGRSPDQIPDLLEVNNWVNSLPSVTYGNSSSLELLISETPSGWLWFPKLLFVYKLRIAICRALVGGDFLPAF